MNKLLLAALIAIFGISGFFVSQHQKVKDSVTLYLLWEPQAQFLGYYVAKERGFFAEEGLDVDIRHDLGAGESFIRLQQEENSYAINQFTNLLNWNSQNSPLDIVSVISVGCNIGWIGAETETALISNLAQHPYYSWWGSHDLLLQTLLRQRGVSLNGQGQRAVKAYPQSFKDAKSILIMLYNEFEDFKSEKFGRPMTYCDLGLPIFEDTLITSTSTSDAKMNLNSRLRRAIWKAWDWTQKNPEAALTSLNAYSPRRNQASQRKQLELFLTRLTPEETRSRDHRGVEATLQKMISFNILEKVAAIKKIQETLRSNVSLREWSTQ